MQANALTDRLRTQLALVQSQWVAVPATLRTAWEQFGARVRTALDLPSREELQGLASRLDALDARMTALADRRAATAAAEPPPAKPNRRAKR